MADNIAIDYDRKIFDFEGEPLIEPEKTCPMCKQAVGDGKPFTVRGILMSIARLNPKDPKDDQKGDKAFEAFQAGLKIGARDKLNSDDVTLLKESLAKSSYDTLIKGQVRMALDQDDSPFAKGGCKNQKKKE